MATKAQRIGGAAAIAAALAIPAEGLRLAAYLARFQGRALFAKVPSVFLGIGARTDPTGTVAALPTSHPPAQILLFMIGIGTP